MPPPDSGDDVTASTADVAPPRSTRPDLPRGALIDRYIIVDPLGTGGMGVVYKAYDPELGRPIALKLLRTVGDAASTQRDRLVREAQALARLSHPNVINVHDVGTFEGDVFIAMEFVEGVTLRRWLAAAQRAPREILEVLTAAGDGLVAAHRAGLVHRDFKPDNVLIGSDGRVRVIDFGLARATGNEPSPSESGRTTPPAGAADREATVDERPRESPRPPRSAATITPAPAGPAESGQLLASPLTHAGSVIGTPRYMAPEQHQGERVDEKADQFSFCLTLWEALWGNTPFAGKLMPSAAIEGDLGEPPADSKAPRWLRGVLRRGLQPDPAARHPSMAALLARLRADPSQARRQRIGLGLFLTIVALGTVGWRLQVRRQANLCRGAEGRLAGVWDDARRAAVRAAFLGSGTPYAEPVLRAVETSLDQYARAWSAMQIDACEATKVRHEQPEEVLALRTSCLDNRLVQLKTLVVVYSGADAKVVESAAGTVPSLPSFGLCSDVAALRAATPPRDPETRRRVDAIRRELATANALGLGARYDHAIGVSRTAVVAAAQLEYPRIEAESELQLARLLDGRGDYAEALRTYHQALVAAVAAHDEEAAARATLGLLDESGVRLSHFEEADRWAALAEAEVRQLPRQEELLGLLYTKRSSLRRSESRYDDALADATRALELQIRVLGPDAYNVAETWFALANLQRFRAQLPEALDGYRRAIAIWTKVLGPDHPMLASTMVGLADVYGEQGEHGRAIDEYKRALATLDRVQPNHPTAAVIHNDLGSELIALGKVQEGFDEYKRALDLWSARLGPSQELTIGYNNLGEAKLVLDAPDEALRYLSQGNDLCGRSFGSDHLCGVIQRNMGEAYRRLGRLDQARACFARSLAGMEKALGPKHPELVATLLGLARVALADEAAATARPLLERARGIAEPQPGDGAELAEVRFALAETLWLDGKHAEARTLAAQAQGVLAGAGALEHRQLAEANRWLAGHR